MGLDAHVSHYFSMRMGPYSSIHRQRRDLIEMVVKYCLLKEKHPTSETGLYVPTYAWKEASIELTKWLEPDKTDISAVVNYTNVAATNLDFLLLHSLGGLKWFVDHSDDDGYWSPGQCLDMYHLFNTLSANGFVDDFLNGPASEYMQLFVASVKHHIPVTFY